MNMFIRQAGWGIYPVLLFGFVGLVLALRHAARPTRGGTSLVVGLSVATLLLGALGTVTGLQVSATHIGEVSDVGRIFLYGMAEALNNLIAALLFAVLHALAGTIGAYRGAVLRSVPAA
jgi:hypothetical protein